MSSTINIIDPVYFNNKSRAEFRLNHENVAYLSSGCYLALGGYGVNATSTKLIIIDVLVLLLWFPQLDF